MKTEPTYKVSQDAMIASTINHFIGSITGETKEDRDFFTWVLHASLRILIPQQIEADKEWAQATYITLMAKATDMMELEAEMLTMLRPTLNTDNFSILANINYDKYEKNETFLKMMAEILMPFIQIMGVTDIRKAFDEIDDLSFMVEDEDQEQQGGIK